MRLGLGNVQALMWFLNSLDLAREPIHHASCLWSWKWWGTQPAAWSQRLFQVLTVGQVLLKNPSELWNFLKFCFLLPFLRVGCQAPLSLGFSRQEYWSGLPCPPPGDLPNPGIEPTSLMSPASAGKFLTTSLFKELPLHSQQGPAE